MAGIKADGQPVEPPVMRAVPSTLSLDDNSTCPCQTPRICYDHDKPIERRSVTIWGLLEASTTTIEIQKCPACPHGYIGPEGSSYGVFNFNNRTLLTLTLLDDYTATFTKSETPFVSWVSSTTCRYENFQSPIPFIKEKVFRAAWFSYARLLCLDEDMRCPQCGPTPEVTIWDGVTLSFSRKNLLSSLCPPTVVDEHSERKPEVKLETGLQFISDRNLRREVVSVLQGPALELPELQPNSALTPAAVAMMARITMIPSITEKLASHHVLLGTAFNQWSGTDVLFARRKPSAAYKECFLQLSAEENALQLLNGLALENLERFLIEPFKPNLFLLRASPAVYKAVTAEFEQNSGLSQAATGLLQWIYIRSKIVLSRLTKAGHSQFTPTSLFDAPGQSSWRKTGSCYGMSQIRNRPHYPAIPRDGLADLGGTDLRGEGCQKFYSTYGENRQTGGLMCVWCPHSVCYGFHIIPFAEGRNDVFSAIYTHWEKGPSVIVYDFACALQPYCLVREPEFFSKTLFVIDAFHAKGHTKCGRASFLTTYLDTNPELIMVNSSAGECGNSGILRIRKSVSYMSQDRAIIYTKVFLSIWNRQRIRKLES